MILSLLEHWLDQAKHLPDRHPFLVLIMLLTVVAILLPFAFEK